MCNTFFSIDKGTKYFPIALIKTVHSPRQLWSKTCLFHIQWESNVISCKMLSHHKWWLDVDVLDVLDVMMTTNLAHKVVGPVKKCWWTPQAIVSYCWIIDKSNSITCKHTGVCACACVRICNDHVVSVTCNNRFHLQCLSSTGLYACSECDHPLFSSRSKFEHSSPWPAFTETVQKDSVSKHLERPGAFKVSPTRSPPQHTVLRLNLLHLPYRRHNRLLQTLFIFLYLFFLLCCGARYMVHTHMICIWFTSQDLPPQTLQRMIYRLLSWLLTLPLTTQFWSDSACSEFCFRSRSRLD